MQMLAQAPPNLNQLVCAVRRPRRSPSLGRPATPVGVPLCRADTGRKPSQAAEPLAPSVHWRGPGVTESRPPGPCHLLCTTTQTRCREAHPHFPDEGTQARELSGSQARMCLHLYHSSGRAACEPGIWGWAVCSLWAEARECQVAGKG